MDVRLKADADAIPLAGSLFFSAAVETAVAVCSVVTEAAAAVWIAAGSSSCSYCVETVAAGVASANQK